MDILKCACTKSVLKGPRSSSSAMHVHLGNKCSVY